MKTVLLTLGRLPKALALVRACRAAGCRVLVADPFRWHVCKPSRDVERCFRVTAPNDSLEAYLAQLLEIIDAEGVDVVMPVSEEALFVAQLAERLPVGVALRTGNFDALRALHHKEQFAHDARALALAVPDTFTADDPAAAEFAANHDFVEKPVHSCSGIGLRLARAGDGLSSASKDCVVQARLDGEHVSSLSLVHEGREIASVFYRGRVFSGTVAICFERLDHSESAKQWVSQFVAGYGQYSGFLAFDFILDDGGNALAIECNPRVTSGVHFFDAQSLGDAILDPANAANVELSNGTRYQWAYSTLTEAYAALPDFSKFRRCWAEVLGARDVIWSLRDPWPFFLMTPMSWEILWPAMTSDVTLGEATQRDIAWFGTDS